MGIGIADIAFSLPTTPVDSIDIARTHGFELEFIVDKLGISRRWQLTEGETVSGLASRAVETLLEQTGTDRGAVQVLVVVTQTPDYQLPHVSALVQGEVGLPKDALVMDVNLGCSGYVVGLSTLKAIMESHEMQFGILVTVDAYSRILDPNDRATAPLFGDASTATLLSSDPVYTIGRAVYGSDGSRSEALIVHGSGSTSEPPEPLHMDGRGIFNFALTVVPESIHQCLAENGLSQGDVDSVVLHQANRFMIESIARRMEFDPGIVVVDLDDVGNTTSSSIPIALKRRVLSESQRPVVVLISGFGVGLGWATNVLLARRSDDR